MHTTGNLKLKKPEGTDVVNIEDINSNMDKLDTEVAKKVSHSTDGRMAKEDKIKLDGIASGANKYVHPSTHSIDMISETSSKKVMTSTERSKLAGIASGANKYVHPSKHSAGVITQDSSHRFVTDSEKSSWSSKVDGKHTHDDRYYTESEVNSKLSKIDTSITHIKNDVSSNKNKISDNAYKSAGGSTNSISVSKTGFALSTGHFVDFKARYTNTGNVNLSVNSYSYKDLKNADGTELSAGDIEANNYYRAIWNGSFFVLASKGGMRINRDEILKLKTSSSVSSSHPINKGDLVTVNDGLVSKSSTRMLFSSKQYNIASNVASPSDVTKITDKKILVAYADSGLSNKVKCRILEINDDDNTVIYGEEHEFDSNVNLHAISVAKFNDNTAVVCYMDSRNNQHGICRTLHLNMDDNSITSHSSYVIFESGEIEYNEITVTELTNNKVVVIYVANKMSHSDDADVIAKVLTYEGDRPIVHSENKIGSNALSSIDSVQLNSTHFALIYYYDKDDDDDYVYGYVRSYSVNSSNNIMYIDSIQFDNDIHYAVAMTKMSDTQIAVANSQYDRRDRDDYKLHCRLINFNSSGHLTTVSHVYKDDMQVGNLAIGKLTEHEVAVFYYNHMRVFSNDKLNPETDFKASGGSPQKTIYISGNKLLLFRNGFFHFIHGTTYANGIALQKRSSSNANIEILQL